MKLRPISGRSFVFSENIIIRKFNIIHTINSVLVVRVMVMKIIEKI